MKLRLFAIVLFLLVSACAPTVGAPVAATPEATAANATRAATVVPVVNTRTDRRAPTLAPTSTATVEPTLAPTEIPTDVPTATSTVAALPTATKPPATASQPTAPVVAAAPGVYVTAFAIDPPAPKSKPAEFVFHASFLNTVGTPVNYPRWRVLIVPKGQTKAQGDPQGASKTIANGASKQDTEQWSIKVIAGCETYTAQPVWEDEDGRQTPFTKPDGSAVGVEFQVCA